MNFFRNAGNHIKYTMPFGFPDAQEPSWANSLRLARDSYYTTAGLGIVGLAGIEIATDPTTITQVAKMACLTATTVSLVGAHFQNQELRSEVEAR